MKSTGMGDRSLVKYIHSKNKIVNQVENQQVFLEAWPQTRNFGFLDAGDLRILGECIGGYRKSIEPGIWNLGKT
jgi:hypothetical protein